MTTDTEKNQPIYSFTQPGHMHDPVKMNVPIAGYNVELTASFVSADGREGTLPRLYVRSRFTDEPEVLPERLSGKKFFATRKSSAAEQILATNDDKGLVAGMPRAKLLGHVNSQIMKKIGESLGDSVSTYGSTGSEHFVALSGEPDFELIEQRGNKDEILKDGSKSYAVTDDAMAAKAYEAFKTSVKKLAPTLANEEVIKQLTQSIHAKQT